MKSVRATIIVEYKGKVTSAEVKQALYDAILVNNESVVAVDIEENMQVQLDNLEEVSIINII